MNDLSYRPDIDGLRAVAVLAVVFHHLSTALVPGGFAGVDIFFVISGFLITSQVWKECREGRFSLIAFYKRRINRIIPALLVVIGATLAAGALLLSPGDLVRLARSAVTAFGGFSNVFFWQTYGNYFAANAAEAPLLHTWSLGVEEQFYVIWPLLLLMLLKVGARFRLALLALLLVAAVAISQVGTGMMASASYYLLPTRFFELMAGGLLAIATLGGGARPLARRAAALAGWAGLALIFLSLALLDKSSVFPGLNAVWPCAGAVLVIWAGLAAPNRLLGTAPMVFVGRISYSLYLWHWPLIAYANYLGAGIGLATGLALLCASIGLAWLSWKFVEQPLRRSGAQAGTARVFLLRFAAPGAACVLVALAIGQAGGFPQRFDARVAVFDRMTEARPELLRAGCHVPTARYATPPDPACLLGEKTGAPASGLLIGDSFANHFTGMIDVMARAERLTLMDYTMDGCPPIQSYRSGKGGRYEQYCIKRNDAVYGLIAARRYRQVVLAANWPDQPGIEDKLVRSVEAILASGAELTLVLNNRHIAHAASCPIRGLMYGDRRSCDTAPVAPLAYLERVLQRYPQVHVVDPNLVICGAAACSPVLNGKLLYRDDYHLNDVGSREIGSMLRARGVTLAAPVLRAQRL